MASAGWAFYDYESAKEILTAVEPIECRPEGKVITTIEFKPEDLDVSVFRPYDEQDIKLSTVRSREQMLLGRSLRNWARGVDILVMLPVVLVGAGL